jgi:predicted DCC family thiol-disulfide oxidoreductase YuxK
VPEGVHSAAVLYDADCRFCRWSLGKLLAWDRHRRLRPVALQDAEADALLGRMDPERRMSSWHLVTPDGRVHSAGEAVAPLMRLLPGGRPLAAFAAACPRLIEHAYAFVADHRGRFGRLVPRDAAQRADARIRERS